MAAVRITYDKLVRDKVPAAIEADGHTCSVAVLLPDEFFVALKQKLVEEAREALASSTHEELLLELADLMEVIRSLATLSGASSEALEEMRLRRRDERGGFEQRIHLRYVDRDDPRASDRTS